MSNKRLSRPSSAVYNRGNARARLTIKILIYILSVFLVGTILSYFIFYNKDEIIDMAGAPIDRSAFGNVTTRGTYSLWDGTTYTEPDTEQETAGSGTQDDPYLISSASQFMYLSKITSESSFNNKYWQLTTDLDLTANRTAISSFNGYFDGGNHTIMIDLAHGSLFGSSSNVLNVSNLTIDTTGSVNTSFATGSTSNAYGILFDAFTGSAEDSTVSNVHLKGYGVINVSLASDGTYSAYVGSLIGSTTGKVATVYVEDIAIQVVAYTDATLDDCTNMGEYYFGGVVGKMADNGTISECLWTGSISFGNYMAGTRNKQRNIALGGITGYGSPSTSISQGKISYNYLGDSLDYTNIGGISAIPTDAQDLASSRDLITNVGFDITSSGHPTFTAFAGEIVNQSRINLQSTNENETQTLSYTAGDQPNYVEDSQMTLAETYDGLTEDLIGSTFVLTDTVNDGYPWFDKWANATTLISTIKKSNTLKATAFSASSNSMSGSGTSSSPFIITTAAQFLIMANYYNNNTATSGYYWKISPYSSSTSATITFNLGNSWVPIGYDTSHAFSGILDGGGVVITGLGITTSYSYVGLFGYVASGAKISNLGICGTTASTSSIVYDYSSASYVGGLVGYLSKGAYIENCYFIGKLTGYMTSTATRVIGGLAGYYENVISGTTVTPAIKTSYYIADHTIYFTSGSTTNTKVEHMEKIYGTGATGTPSWSSQSFTTQSTFTPYGFSFGNLTATSGNYAWTSAYAGKWHTTAGIYNGYPYLDASDSMYFNISRASATALTGSYMIGTVSGGNLVFTNNVSQYLPVRAVFSLTYTKGSAYDTTLALSLVANSKTLFSKSQTFSNTSASVSMSNLALTANYTVTGTSLTVKATNYAKHTLNVTNSTPSLGSFSRTDSNSLITATAITNGYKYYGRSTLGLKFTANTAANSVYYYIKSITVGGTALYTAATNAAIKTVTNCSAAISTKLGSTAGTANTYASVITLTYTMPNTASTTAIVVTFGSVKTTTQNISFNTDSGVTNQTGSATVLTIVSGTKVTDSSGNLPTKASSISGYSNAKFIGWLEYKTSSTTGKLVSNLPTLDFKAESDTSAIKELWSQVASSVSFTNATARYTISHKVTGLSYTFGTPMTNMMVGTWVINNLTTGKSAEVTITSSTTTVNLNSLTWK